ncbi:1-aminocyclopropane-1-carboxylate deaminase/D-cysteine desulfhydrase [Vibrio hippocampi]|uniref:1-aminocyclopropane-1-carboxylate deaminase n=1 Tax=Vibrio hippocampi TaxID=654686 RepID=A0ABM8ZIE2_9VIBR|nr:1-aminocyclopropane-1-carboxylate deaminase/D-cysteine desulfhydrase [Vibrio hippocampi]CAH0526413.1 hypothetical protein VHP8226_01793 [Vibrio hippocampi]
MNLKDSPVTQHCFHGQRFYLKRDDLLHGHFNGNKARKFYSLLTEPAPKVTRLIGWGSAQANSLTALAALACVKGWKLTFYVDHKPHWLDKKPIGNYRTALELGAEIISLTELLGKEAPHPQDYIEATHGQDPECLIVPEGGRSTIAKPGIDLLAAEILDWARLNNEGKPLKVALPSGTGTTALFLAQTLQPNGIEVLTCPCVGGKEYLKTQFRQLGQFDHTPTILELDYKHHFGKLYPADYEIWTELQQQTHIEFDLLYDPMMWQCLLEWQSHHPDHTLLYIHQGGLLGNESMVARYERDLGARVLGC